MNACVATVRIYYNPDTRFYGVRLWYGDREVLPSFATKDVGELGNWLAIVAPFVQQEVA